MIYYVRDLRDDSWREAKNWWKLIDYFAPDDDFGYGGNLDNVAHTENDKSLSYSIEGDYRTYVYESRYLMVYDEDLNIVNLHELREGVKLFKPGREKYVNYKLRYFAEHHFEFRKDPVPGIHVRHWNYCRRVKKNKNYVARLLAYADLFPTDARLRQLKYFVHSWDDDFTTSKGGKSWKKTKKRKQWM